MEANVRPLFYCFDCQDSGLIEIFHPSTDALIGYYKCTACKPVLVYKYSDPWGKDIKFPSSNPCPF